MNQPPEVIAVTGASGYVGALLLQKLQDQGDLRKLVAIDLNPPPLPIHNIAVYRQDVTDPIDELLDNHRVSTLVHLAFITEASINRREIMYNREANLGSLRSVLNSCLRARIKHFVYLSSHTVYGAHPDNPVPLSDGAPLRPSPEIPYAYDKFLSEQIIQEFAEQHPETKVTVLRPCLVLGPNADNKVTRAFFRPWLMAVHDCNPPIQFLYEDDLARVLTIIIKQGIPGIFNVAGEGVVFYRELAEIIKSRLIELPAFLSYPLVQLTWRLHLQRHSTAAGLDMVRYPIVVSTSKLRHTTGYRFWHTSRDALESYTNACLFYQDAA
jgi:UDP-glucose 4-epimerase